MIEIIAQINDTADKIVWGTPALTLLIGTGVLLTFLTKGFQFTHFFYALCKTVGSLKIRSSKARDAKAISQFQALCTALSATIGTGNISGIAYAITIGGPGAIFWMWIATLVGMITSFAEKILGIYFRRRNAEGEWCGGAMYYLEYGLGGKRGCKSLGRVLALLFALFTMLASFGIGNLSQIASIRESIFSLTSFTGNLKVDSFILGVVVAVAAAFVILGGLTRIAKANETLVPFMAGFYILGAVIIIASHGELIIPAFASILRHAFSLQAAVGGTGGFLLKQAITCGFKRGVFSNEAGMGSSVIVHATADVREPVEQGLWGIFEVFFDTILICTLTALVILTSGLVDLNTGRALTESTSLSLATEAFCSSFGLAGGIFMAAAVTLFAFATVLGWNFYGAKACEYLLGAKAVTLYKYIYIAVILLGCTLNVDLIIALSDTFNGLMAIPNLIGVLSLTGTVMALLNNYKKRVFNGEKVKPMLSYFPEIEKELLRK